MEALLEPVNATSMVQCLSVCGSMQQLACSGVRHPPELYGMAVVVRQNFDSEYGT